MELDVPTAMFALSVGGVVFSIGVFIGTTRSLSKRLFDMEKTVHGLVQKVEDLRVDLAGAKMRRNGDAGTLKGR